MSQDTPQATVQTVTPSLAHQLLATKHRADRAVLDIHVERLASDMRLGYWVLNGESIKINVEGEVIDGQHRLHACILADKPFDTLVVRDLSINDEVQFTTDNGRKRSLADALRIRGEHYTNEIAGALGTQWRFLTGKMSSTVSPSVPIALKLFARFGGSDQEPGLRSSAKIATQLRGQGRVPISGTLATWGYFVFGEIASRSDMEADLHAAFWNGLYLGTDLVDNDPRLHLRNRFIDHSNRLKATKTMGRAEMYALTIKAWNRFADGQPMTSSALRWRQVAPGRETFPELSNQDLLADWFRIRL